MRRALRILLPVAAIGLIAVGTLASQGKLNLSRLDFASLLSSGPSTTSVTAPAAEKAKSPREAEAPAISPVKRDASAGSAATTPPGPSKQPPFKIDFARIVADGTSVIGGYAPPGSRVSIHGNGEVVTTVTAADSGQWSAILTRAFSAGPLSLTITSDDLSVAGQESAAIVVDVPKSSGHVELAAAEAKPKPILPPSREAVQSRAVGEFAALVERARNQTGKKATETLRQPGIVPVPITFVTGEAAMTTQGVRAAHLLSEYVKIVHPASITLSGHADERGTDTYNVELSRRRLEVIRTLLRKGGYTGGLSLLAKGKSEPYQGIDRHSASIEEIYQADRRVELRLPE